jgi:molybdopterin/thiamine biosynthesis adenylyltransferase
VNSREIKEILRPDDANDPPPRSVRLPSFIGLDRDLFRILDALEVCVVGAGSVGLPICTHLAQLSPRSLLIVDPHVFKRENLRTQRITPDAVGINKATYTGQLCKRISPRTSVLVYEGRAEELPFDALCSMDLVMLAGDNLTLEVDVAQRCLHGGVPLIQSSVAGESLVAQIRFCANRDGNGPCLACAFAQLEWAALNRETVYSCEGAVTADATPQPANRAATRSVGFLCSLAADLAMMQLLRFLGGLGRSVADTHLEYCGYTHRTCISPLTRNDHCPCEHAQWARCRLPRPARSYSPRELSQIALGDPATLAGVSMTIDGLQFCESGICAQCGASQPVGRFIRSFRGLARCAHCSGMIDALPFCTHRPAPLTVLGECLDRRLEELVDEPPESVIVRGPHRTAWCGSSVQPKPHKF